MYMRCAEIMAREHYSTELGVHETELVLFFFWLFFLSQPRSVR